jgi:hypothetical protein
VEQRYAGELDKDMAAAMRKLRQRGENDLADDVYNAISYHVDHGNGMDCYKVGPTLGAGTNALLADGGKTISTLLLPELRDSRPRPAALHRPPHL